MARRLARLTPQACLDAVSDWLQRRLKCSAASGHLLQSDDALWIELSDITCRFEDEPIPYIRGVLLPRVPRDLDAPLTDDVLIVTLHLSDPTPIVERSGNTTSTSRPLPWQTIAIVATPEGVEARGAHVVEHGLGMVRRWPFSE